ncbi:host specificity factor TipJ family phage tail protein [Veillonella caviae]|uniref:host specificity factor TipJ family phage tail protein n=1 Tax=Veillonella caviae TaxID=248316 RepID=UPI002A90EEB5|nr:host specificity factor TipJ family phage tail protein [Veillonella caviae]MDY6225389.1 host specificity factor TipJ family phage tail protein [Veillonella caviae]
MIKLVIARNPFDLTKRQETLVPFVEGKALSSYFTEPGNWIYSINGQIVESSVLPKDDDYIVIMPKLEKQVLGLLLTIGVSMLTAGIGSGAIFGITSMLGRTIAAMAIGMIGNSIISKLTAPKVDNSNTEQSPTYGWQGAQTVVGQGHPLAITFGKMKSAGMLISRHVTSDGSKQYLNLLYCAGEGPIDSITDVKLNGNPVGNYKDVQVDFRLGTNDQSVIPNFNDNYADQPLTYELTNDWSVHQTQGNLSNAIELTVSLPNGLYYANNKGGLSDTSVQLEAGIRKAGTAEWTPLPLSNEKGQSAMVTLKDGQWFKLNSHSQQSINLGNYRGVIRDSANSAIYRVYRFDVGEPGQYEIRMRCANKDGRSARHINKVYWSQLTQIVYDDFIHPGKVLIGIKALATDQLNGSDPNVTWLQERKTVWVFNSYTGVYEAKAANNPAWACYDILHHCRKIGGEYVVKGAPRERFIYDAFKAWAEKCDERHITFNYIFDNASQVWDALKYAENVGRGKVIPLGTRFSCVYDYAAQPTQLFTVGNIKLDSFVEEFQSTASRANAIEVSFLNKQKDYERDVLPVFSEDYDVTTSLASPAQVELMGCDNVDEAYAYAKHYLRANKYEIRTCTFEAFTDAIACTIGDVILLQHDVTEWGQGGRIVRAKGNIVTLDRPVTFDRGKRYRLIVRNHETDYIETYDVASVNGSEVTLTQATALSTDDLYTYGEASKEAKPFRVLAINKSNSEMTRKITCIEYYPELYADDDGDVPIVDYTTTSDVIKVTNLIVVADAKTLKDGTVLCDIVATWQMPRDKVAKTIQVWYKPVTSQEWQQFAVLDGSATSVTIPSVATDMNYDIRVMCANDIGTAYEGVERSVYVLGKEIPPNVPKGFMVKQDRVNSSVLHLSWEPNTEADLYGYRLYDGNNVVLIKHIGGTSYSYFIPTSGNYAFKLKAVDTSGNESEPATAGIKADVNAANVAIPNAPAKGEVIIRKNIKVTWDPVENTYIDYYEVRTDSEVGKARNCLAKTTDIIATIELKDRRGAVFVYAHNPVKGYGAPLRVDYNAPTPKAPTNVKVNGGISGIYAVLDSIPDTCIGANIYIDTVTYFFTSNVINIPADSGIHSVYVAYVDMFGEGPRTDEILVTVRATIPKELLDREELGLNEIDKRLSEITKISQNIDKRIDIKAGEVTKTAKDYADSKVRALDGTVQSQITQFSNAIQSKVSSITDTSNVISSYAKAVQAMSRSPQLIQDPIFKSNVELLPYVKDGQQITVTPKSPSAKWGDAVTGGRLLGIIPADKKYSWIGYGGFRIMPNNKPLMGELNNTYVVRMTAKVKPTMTIHLNNNDIAGGTSGFLTSNKGTDKTEEYVFYWKYGKAWDPNNSNGHDCGYVYFKDVSGQRSNNDDFITWISKIEVFAIDSYDNSIDEVKSSITQLNNSITSKVENATKGLQSKITQLSDAVDSKISNESSKTSTRITQLDNAIKAQVITGDKVMSAITQYSGGTRIDGELLHVTGQSLFDDNIITNKMLQANAVTADKMSVNNLSAISANLGEVYGGKIIGGRLQNRSGSFMVDENGNIKGANITASRIDAQSILQAGFQIRNIEVKVFKVKHGNWCPLPEGFSENQCTFVPVGYLLEPANYYDRARMHISVLEKIKSRWINDNCSIYLRGEDGKQSEKIGLAGVRRAVVELQWATYIIGNNDREVQHYQYGDLFVLVVARK